MAKFSLKNQLRLLSRSKIRVILASSAVIVCFLFISLLDSQKKNTDPTLVRQTLEKSEQVREIKTWEVKFLHCTATCEPVGEESYTIDFPSFDKTGEIVKSITPKPTDAILKYKLSDEDRYWIKKNPIVILILPRMVHQYTINQTTFERTKSHGLGSNATFSMTSKSLASKTHLKVEIKFQPYDFFGPADLPIALANPQAASTYASISSLAISAGFLGKQLEIGIPLLLTCIALILDHSLVFSILSVLATFRALRFFVSFDYTLPDRMFSSAFADPALIVINAVSLVILVLFILEFSHVKFRKSWKWIFGLITVIGFFIANSMMSTFIQKADLWSDLIACLIGIPIAIYGLKISYHREPSATNDLEREVEKTTAISTALLILRFGLVIFALMITAWVNGSDLLEIGNSGMKESLNWAHSALLPILIVTSLLEIGSTSKKMELFSQVMVSKALIDRDMQVGKEIQEHLLPVRRGNNSSWAWRAFYYPAISLAGDWFDIRIIKFKDGKEYILCCLADVTGHGIGAALITTTISSHWGIWCDRISKMDSPQSDEEREQLLVQAPKAIHEGLTALKRNSGCTAGFMLLDNNLGKMTYSIAGHPGILTEKKEKMGFYFTPGARPGFEGTTLQWQAKTTDIDIGESIHLFSDGLVPPGQAVGVWLKKVQRAQKKSTTSLSLFLLSAIRENRGRFRKDRTKEDDMSLIVLTRIS